MPDSRTRGRLILPQVPIFRPIKRGFASTGVLLPYMLEEAISRGITSIVLADPWRYEDTLPTMPPRVRRLIIKRPTNRVTVRRVSAVLSPLRDELDIETTDGGRRFMRKLSKEEERLSDAADTVEDSLIDFLNAVRAKAQVQININDMKRKLRVIVDGSRSHDMRHNAALLYGFFSSYRKIEHAGLSLADPARAPIQELFMDFIENPNYISLSKQVYVLGLSATASGVLRRIGNAVSRILADRRLSRLVDYGTRTAKVATSVPIPELKLLESLVQDRYLPPIIDVQRTIDRAYDRMQTEHPTVGRFAGDRRGLAIDAADQNLVSAIFNEDDGVEPVKDDN